MQCIISDALPVQPHFDVTKNTHENTDLQVQLQQFLPFHRHVKQLTCKLLFRSSLLMFSFRPPSVDIHYAIQYALSNMEKSLKSIDHLFCLRTNINGEVIIKKESTRNQHKSKECLRNKHNIQYIIMKF